LSRAGCRADAGPRHAGRALSLIALAFNALAIIQALTTWSTDLVEERRRLRLFIVVAAAVYGAAYAGQQLLLKASELPMRASVANAIVLALIVAAIAAALTRSSGDTIFPVAGSTGEMPETPSAGVATTSLDAADRKLVATLDRLMQYDRVYRHDNMTIGTLALKLGVPEYRLRRLINRTLGYRNFNAFLNNYRIEEAKAALADPAQIKVPVLTIAMDAGFQSLGPFNRAFKTTTGVTPTEYRRLRSAAA
jgi:AraC-like DNA-binding protein